MSQNILNMKSATLAMAAAVLTALLTGCGVGPINTTAVPQTVATEISGTVHGGQTPISHSLVQLWETSTSTYGGTATQLVASTYSNVTTGTFSFGTANVPANCTSGPYAYITATGGDPTGTTATSTNTGILMMAMVGACSTTGSSTTVVVNELTTLAAAYALSGFATDSSGTIYIGAPSTNTQGLADAVANAGLLVNATTGVAKTSTSSILVPTALINTLGNSLSACVNTASTSSSLSTNCSNLYTYTTPPGGGTAPSDTFQAALNMAKYPGNNVYNILNLGNGQSAFNNALSISTPSNTSTVNDIAIAIAFTNPKVASASTTGIGLAIDSADNVVFGGTYLGSSNTSASTSGNYFVTLSSASAGATEAVTAYPSGINSAATPQAAAVDSNNTVWLGDSSGGDLIKIPNENIANATQILLTSPDGGTPTLTGAAGTADVAQDTYGVAIDASNNIWTTAYRSQGNCTNSGTAANSLCNLEDLPGGTGTTFSYQFGSGSVQEFGATNRYLTVDASTNSTKGNVWLPNYGGTSTDGPSGGSDVGTVSIITPGSGTVAASVVNVVVNSALSSSYGSAPYAVALDASSNGWVTTNVQGTTNTTSYALYKVPYNATSSTTPTAATNASPSGINSTLNTPATTSSPAAAPIYAVGGLNAPRDLAIDGAGNIFIANYGFKTVVEYSPSAGGFLSPNYGFAPTFASPVYIYSYSITSACVATFNTPNNLVVGQTVVLSGFSNAAGTFMNSQTVSVTTAAAASFKATVTSCSGSTVSTTQDSGVATPTSTVPVTFSCTNSSSTNTCSVSGVFSSLGAIAIDRAGSVWTVGYNNGTLIEMLGTAAPTDPLLSDGKYGARP